MRTSIIMNTTFIYFLTKHLYRWLFTVLHALHRWRWPFNRFDTCLSRCLPSLNHLFLVAIPGTPAGSSSSSRRSRTTTVTIAWRVQTFNYLTLNIRSRWYNFLWKYKKMFYHEKVIINSAVYWERYAVHVTKLSHPFTNIK